METLRQRFIVNPAPAGTPAADCTEAPALVWLVVVDHGNLVDCIRYEVVADDEQRSAAELSAR